MPAPLLFLLIALVGAAAGVAVVVARSGRTPEVVGARAEQGLLRLTADVRTGWEQTLLGLVRELGLPRGAGELRYGQLYIETRSEQRLLVRSRSEIGRGFVGAIDLQPRRGVTRVAYAVLRLPGDDGLHARLLELEEELVAALHRIDPGVDVTRVPGTLNDLHRRPTVPPDAVDEPEPR